MDERTVHCPNCGESISILIDDSVAQQNYIEDCEVCCRPINFSVSIGLDGDINILATSDNE